MSVIYFSYSEAKEGFQTQLFKTQVLTQPDFENLEKINFKPEKGHFWFTLKGPLPDDCFTIARQLLDNVNVKKMALLKIAHT